MKYLLFYTLGLFFLSQVSAQSLTDLVKAFRDGNVAGITNYLDKKVEITFEGANSTYNKSDASSFLNNFFSEKKVNNFKVLHQSQNRETAYLIANMNTSGGNFRITLFTQEKDQKVLLQEIRIEK